MITVTVDIREVHINRVRVQVDPKRDGETADEFRARCREAAGNNAPDTALGVRIEEGIMATPPSTYLKSTDIEEWEVYDREDIVPRIGT